MNDHASIHAAGPRTNARSTRSVQVTPADPSGHVCRTSSTKAIYLGAYFATRVSRPTKRPRAPLGASSPILPPAPSTRVDRTSHPMARPSGYRGDPGSRDRRSRPIGGAAWQRRVAILPYPYRANRVSAHPTFAATLVRPPGLEPPLSSRSLPLSWHLRDPPTRQVVCDELPPQRTSILGPTSRRRFAPCAAAPPIARGSPHSMPPGVRLTVGTSIRHRSPSHASAARLNVRTNGPLRGLTRDHELICASVCSTITDRASRENDMTKTLHKAYPFILVCGVRDRPRAGS